MKPTLIFTLSALVAGTTANTHLNAHQLSELLKRTIDPATLDPTRLSVLSVLHTAIPTGANLPMPTGDYEPEWYQKLPEDVKSLLPSLYPATPRSASASQSVSQTSATRVSSGASSLAASSLLLATSSAVMSSVLVSVEAVNASSSASVAPSNSTWTSAINVTKTLQHGPTATATASVTGGFGILANGSNNGTHVGPTATATLPDFFSTGAKTAVKMETLAAVVWMALGAGLYVFA